MKFIKNFQQLSKSNADIAGGKGASLGEMTKAGIPVPPGFVVLAGAFDEFISKTGLEKKIDEILKGIDFEKNEDVESASGKIKELILAQDFPEEMKWEIQENFDELGAEFVAVRSSATAEDGAENAWAGQLESYLNTTEEKLFENIKKCWASLFTPRAIFYRHEKGLSDTKVSVAVVVQKMVQSEVSGIAFTVHPVTQNYDQMIIEAGYGLGEAIVGGMITPDSYVISKSKVESQKLQAIEEKYVSEQEMMIVRGTGGTSEESVALEKRELQKLSDAQIIELSRICVGIENHYGFPCDIEWVFEGGEFYIVQSRPITTLSSKPESISKLKLEKTITRDWPLIIAEMLHMGFIKKFSEQFGFGYSEVLFHFHDDELDVFRATKEHLDGLREFVLENLEKDNKFLSKISVEIKRQYDNLIGKIEFIKSIDLKTLDNKQLWHLINDFIDLHSEIEPRFVINFWFPIHMEGCGGNNEKWKSEIDVAIKTRTETEKVGPEGDLAARKLVNEVADRMSIEKTLSKYLSLKEIENFLQSSILDDVDMLNSRKANGFVFGSLGIIDTDPQGYAEREGYEILEYAVDDGGGIAGTVAYKGNVKGIVRVIKSKTNIADFQENEILVTAMTTPEFVPAMKKAIAFVTDEGGITCHAAIVAREMGKPCIIGTKIATQVLRDGDLVEVDADNGVVNILEKK
ncbi:MAG: Phosphoenolpyruvate synthase [Candidatus Moranbacteria bacterium GW2011_GWE1_49_15]|nr:MAG: Phosphoenolpyruvate synthase [Candidatus Moranbacteria bacterium GW2011_GWE1_49_15]HBP00727.1 hypothetical protein [Candidatus Moranbacteria bacterium]